MLTSIEDGGVYWWSIPKEILSMYLAITETLIIANKLKMWIFKHCWMDMSLFVSWAISFFNICSFIYLLCKLCKLGRVALQSMLVKSQHMGVSPLLPPGCSFRKSGWVAGTLTCWAILPACMLSCNCINLFLKPQRDRPLTSKDALQVFHIACCQW